MLLLFWLLKGFLSPVILFALAFILSCFLERLCCPFFNLTFHWLLIRPFFTGYDNFRFFWVLFLKVTLVSAFIFTSWFCIIYLWKFIFELFSFLRVFFLIYCLKTLFFLELVFFFWLVRALFVNGLFYLVAYFIDIFEIILTTFFILRFCSCFKAVFCPVIFIFTLT